MKRVAKHIVIPMHIWEHPDLTLEEKAILINIDSVCSDADGVVLGVQALTTLSGLKSTIVREALKSLYAKGALSVSVDADGQKKIKPLLYLDRYVDNGAQPIIGDKPTDVAIIDYDLIQSEWAKHCSMLPPIKRWTPQRKQKTRTALKQANLSVDDLIKAFRIIASTPFLNGASSEFKAHYDWLTSKSTNLSKVYEGFYSRSIAEKSAYDDIINGRQTQVDSDADSYYK